MLGDPNKSLLHRSRSVRTVCEQSGLSEAHDNTLDRGVGSEYEVAKVINNRGVQTCTKFVS